MNQQEIRFSPYHAAIQTIADEVGRRKCNEREFAGMSGSIGVWLWIDLTIKAIEALKKRGEWRFEVPNEATVRRRLNYLADSDWIDQGIPRPEDYPPKWKHLNVNINDSDRISGHVSNQSAYQPIEIRTGEVATKVNPSKAATSSTPQEAKN